MSESATVLKALQKDFGDHIGSAGVKKVNAPRIQTGIFQLDLATGGGIPRGRLSIVYGAESSGKTTIAYLLMACVQRVHKQKAVFIDVENTFDPEWAAQCGVSTKDLIVMNPDTAEQVVDVVEAFLGADDVGIVVIDSIAAMTTENEINSEAGKMIVGGSSMVVGKLVRKSVSALSRGKKRDHYPALLCINQVRFKIGVMFGDPEIFPGGNGLRFASSMTIRMYGKDKFVKEFSDSVPVLRETTATIRKWKVPIVARAFEYDMCVVPHKGLTVGQSESWNTVSNYLKNYGLLSQQKTGWDCMGTPFKTLKELAALYSSDEALRMALQGEVVSRAMKHLLLDSDKAGVKVDAETGEILE